MKNKKTKVGVYYITKTEEPENPIKVFESYRYACNTAMFIARKDGVEISVYQYDEKNDKPIRITTYSV